ncbi:MAG: ArgE/DapE family deacylase [Planctomycetia bacterium]|nr:ArgE/DapE family deacylase [Planctomycetia bacterium]
MLETITNYLSGETERTVEVLKRLIEAETVNPPGDEYKVAAIVREVFEAAKIPCEIVEKEKGRTNLIARVGPSSGQTILVSCHADTVPAGEDWNTEPFKAVLKDGRIYGRGAKDNKGPLAAMVASAQFLKTREKELTGQFVYVVAADEETGSELGMKYLVEGCGLEADAVVVPDAGFNMTQVSVGEKGALFVKLIARGKQAHGSMPEAGVSAIWAIIEVLNRLRAEKFPGEATELFTPPTLNVGVIRGGTVANMVPPRCEVQLDFPYLPGTQHQELLAIVQRHIDEVKGIMPGVEFEMPVMADQPPSLIDPKHPIIKFIQDHAEAVTGRRPEVVGSSGATVTKPFVHKGTPAVAFTCGDKDIEHKANESIAVDEVMDFAAVMTLVLWDLIGPDAKSV